MRDRGPIGAWGKAAPVTRERDPTALEVHEVDGARAPTEVSVLCLGLAG
jgi:hypothetical protein